MEEKILIILPSFNEEQNIKAVIDSLNSIKASNMDILVVNDGSHDKTGQIAGDLGAIVLNLPYNMGYGCALRAGYIYAKKRGYSFVIQMDSDGQHDPVNIDRIYRTVNVSENKPDIILGSRFLKESTGFSFGKAKHLARRLFITLIKLFSGISITDPTTGLQGLDRKVFCFYAEYDNFEDKYPDANILLQMALLGYTIKEVPAIMHERKHGKSMHSGLAPAVYMIRMGISMVAVYFRVKVFRHFNNEDKK